MSTFNLSLRTVTPTFCRGKDAATPELRPSSFKGQLRWWYRAWHPLAVRGPGDGPWAEGRIFGGTTAHTGQSPFLLRLEGAANADTISWKEIERTAPRTSREQVGGIRYLGFSFREARGSTEPSPGAIAQGVSFGVEHRFPRPKDVTDETRRALIAAWWLLVHLGGIGARARRGFGSLAINGWEWPECEALLRELPLPSRAKTADEWRASLHGGLATLARWRGDGTWPTGYPHPYLGPGTTVVMQTNPGWHRADDVLEHAGRALAQGRRDHRGREAIDGRVTVGLPLTTGRRPATKWQPGSWRGERIESDIHASPLHVHVASFKGGFGLTWARLMGPVPGLGEYRIRRSVDTQTLRTEAPNTLDALVASLPGERWTLEAR